MVCKVCGGVAARNSDYCGVSCEVDDKFTDPGRRTWEWLGWLDNCTNSTGIIWRGDGWMKVDHLHE